MTKVHPKATPNWCPQVNPEESWSEAEGAHSRSWLCGSRPFPGGRRKVFEIHRLLVASEWWRTD
jgi:hypothetical protein